MTDATLEVARQLLADLSSTFELDGYTMSVEPANPGIQVVVSANAGACEECLVPPEIFKDIVSAVLEKGGLIPERVEIVYPVVSPH